MYDLNKLFNMMINQDKKGPSSLSNNVKADRVAGFVRLHESLSPLRIARLDIQELLRNKDSTDYLMAYVIQELDRIFKAKYKNSQIFLNGPVERAYYSLDNPEEIKSLLIRLSSFLGKRFLINCLKYYKTPMERYGNNFVDEDYGVRHRAEKTAMELAEHVCIYSPENPTDREKFSTPWRAILLGLGLMPQSSLDQCLFNLFRNRRDYVTTSEKITKFAKKLVIAGANPEARIGKEGKTITAYNPPAEFTTWWQNWKGKKSAAKEDLESASSSPQELPIPKNYDNLNEYEQLVAHVLVQQNLERKIFVIIGLLDAFQWAAFPGSHPFSVDNLVSINEPNEEFLRILIDTEPSDTLIFSPYFSISNKIMLSDQGVKELQKTTLRIFDNSTTTREMSSQFESFYKDVICKFFTEESRLKLFMSQDQETSSPILEKLSQLGNLWLLSQMVNTFSEENQKQLIGEMLKAFATSFLRQEEIIKPTKDQFAILNAYLVQAEKYELSDSSPMALLMELAFRMDDEKLFKRILEHPEKNWEAAEACLNVLLNSTKQLHPVRGLFENFKGVFGKSKVQTYTLMLLMQFPDLIGVVRKHADLAKWADDVERKITASDTTAKKKVESTETAPQSALSYPQPTNSYAGTYDSTIVNTGNKTETKEEPRTAPQSTLSYPQPANPYAGSYDTTATATGEKTETKEEREARKFVDAAFKRGAEEAEAASGSSSRSSSSSQARLLSASRGNPMHAEGSDRAKEVKKQLDDAPAAPTDALPETTPTRTSMSLAHASLG